MSQQGQQHIINGNVLHQLNTQTHTERERERDTTVTDDQSNPQSMDHTSRLLFLLVVDNDDVIHLSTGNTSQCCIASAVKTESTARYFTDETSL